MEALDRALELIDELKTENDTRQRLYQY
jgi:hypothetical protein